MVQLQASPFSKQDTGRMLPSLSHNQQNRHRLEGLADAAICLQEPSMYSPSSTPSSPDFQEFTFGHSIPASNESKSYGIPSIQSLFAIADGDRPRSYGFDAPGPEPGFRRLSTGSEVSFQGSFTSVPELSRLSTASPPPRLVPRTPEAHHAIAPGDNLKIKLTLGDFQEQLKCLEQTNKRRLMSRLSTASPPPRLVQRTPEAHHAIAPGDNLKINLRLGDLEEQLNYLEQTKKRSLMSARGRRSSSRQAPYSTAASDRGHRGSGQPGTPARGKQQKKPHFNLRYPKSVKLFILYHKEDCGWGWKAINKRRVDLLPVLYRSGYKPEIEENREVAGINGFYYRLNEVMPALTPDGSGLRFVEHGGRSWELTEPSKCREGPGRGEERRSGGGARGGRGKDKDDADARRPRGMVDRYPEEVIYYWDEFVKHFVQQSRQAEVYARAKRHCEIRAEQRREKGVPQWAPDNEEERVRHTNPPNAKTKTPRAKCGEADEALPELMSACDLATEMDVD